MQTAILAVSAVAALGALAAVAIPLWQQRPKLTLYFTGAWWAADSYIDFGVRVENRSKAPIYGIRISRFGPGDRQIQGRANLQAIPVLQPGERIDVTVPFERPQRVDVPAVTPVFAVPLIVWAEYGDRRTELVQPAGTFAS